LSACNCSGILAAIMVKSLRWVVLTVALGAALVGCGSNGGGSGGGGAGSGAEAGSGAAAGSIGAAGEANGASGGEAGSDAIAGGAPRGATDLVAGPVALSSFGPNLSFSTVGRSGAPTFPTALTVALSGPAQSDTFISVVSGNSGLSVVGGGVEIPTGMTSGQVLVSGLAQTLDATLTATLGAMSLQAHVRVLGSSELPSLTALTTATPTIAPGSTVTLTATLDIPAPTGGTVVNLALAPANAGTLSATTLIVLADQLTATFDVTLSSSATVTATLGASVVSTSISAAGLVGLVISEIDYDNVGTDSAEFVEIYNPGSTAQALSGYQLVLVNGSNGMPYQTIDLSVAGTLGAGKYLVVGADSVTSTVPSGVLVVDLGAVSNLIQNGSSDGVALVNSNSESLVDALSYEGAITAAVLSGVGTVSLVEGTVLSSSVADSNVTQGSLARLPNGADTNQANDDWRFSSTPTPGSVNVP
jgi:large repetitive protein